MDLTPLHPHGQYLFCVVIVRLPSKLAASDCGLKIRPELSDSVAQRSTDVQRRQPLQLRRARAGHGGIHRLLRATHIRAAAALPPFTRVAIAGIVRTLATMPATPPGVLPNNKANRLRAVPIPCPAVRASA